MTDKITQIIVAILWFCMIFFVMVTVLIVIMRPEKPLEKAAPVQTEPSTSSTNRQIPETVPTVPNNIIFDDADLRVLDQKVRQGLLTPEEARQQLQEIVEKKKK